MTQGSAFGAGSAAPSGVEVSLPDLQEVIFDGGQLRAYLDELHSTGTSVVVTVKRSQRSQVRGDVSVTNLCSEFIAKSLHSAQLRYSHSGTRWVDTLMITPGGVRLIRMPY